MCGDDAYTPHIATALRSMLDHAGETPIEVFIGTTSFDDEHRVRLQHAVPELPITWIDVPRSWLDTMPTSDRPVEHFARLHAIEHLPADVDRVLYLDADILVRDDLAALWSTALGGATIGVVRDGGGPWMAQTQWNFEQLGLDGNLMYANSGVLLVDLDAWRARSTFDRCMTYIETWGQRIEFVDQEVINAVLCHEWLELAPRWNWIPKVFTLDETLRACAFGRDELAEARSDPAIIHFAGPKPWEWANPQRDQLLWLDAWEAQAFAGPHRDWYAAERERGLAERAATRPRRRSPLRRFRRAAAVLLRG